MHRPTWRSAFDEDVHKIDMPPPPSTVRGRASKQAGWKIEKFAAVFKNKLFWIHFFAVIFVLCLLSIVWLWYTGSVAIDEITRAIIVTLVEMQMPRSDGHKELAMIGFAAPLVSSDNSK
ncbi:unnamed protein product [Rhodiola kirilowii]